MQQRFDLGQGAAFYRDVDSHVTVDAQCSLSLRVACARIASIGGSVSRQSADAAEGQG